MPLCPQITNTPVAVVLNGNFTVTNVVPVLPANTEQLEEVAVDATTALDTANDALADATVAIANANTAIANAATANATATAAAFDAGIAQTTANGKAKVNYSTSAASGPGSNGDIWFQVNGSGSVIAQYVYNGGWIIAPITNTVIANLDAGKITAGTITGIAYNNGSGTFSVSPAGALVASSAIITGQITATSGTFTGAVFASSGSFTGAVTATSGSFTGSIFASTGTVGGFTLSGTGLTAGASLSIQTTGTITGGNGQTIFYGFANIGGGSATGARLIVAGTSELNGNVAVLGNITATNSVTFGASTQQFEFLSSSGNVRVAQTYSNSVSGRAMQISSAGLYGTTASTRRKKHEIESYTIDSAALFALDVKTFKYKPEFDPEQQTQHGFIAEEAQALGLDELIQYDSTGEPDYFAYEKLPIFLLQLVQELKAEIDQLKGA